MNENLIRQYAHAELDDEAAKAFEERLSAEPDLRESLELYLALRARDAVASKQRWQKLKAEQPVEETKVIKPLWQKPATWMALAAGIVALAAILWSLDQSSHSALELTNELLAEAYPAPEIAMGSVDQDSLWALASAEYRAGEYNEAAMILELMESRTDEQMFYWGLSELYSPSGSKKAAIEVFKQVDGNYAEAATYYRALAHIQDGQLAEAKALLQIIREGERKQDVEALLEALEP